jgi:hypothetical protein
MLPHPSGPGRVCTAAVRSRAFTTHSSAAPQLLVLRYMPEAAGSEWSGI